MTILFWLIAIGLLAGGTAAAFLSLKPNQIVLLATRVPAALLALVGAVLLLTGRVAIAVGLLAAAVALWRRGGPSVWPAGDSGGTHSTVRSAALDMTLDHDTGDMDGCVLIGPHEGRWLSAMDEDGVLEVRSNCLTDHDSLQLIEAYLDRRFAGWRERTQAHKDGGQGSAAGAGPMTKQEAYQILGLGPEAGPKEVREAHRRLMKRVHPDGGGSTFLAAKINEAKDILLG